ALSLFHSYRFSVTETLAIYGESLITDLPAIGSFLLLLSLFLLSVRLSIFLVACLHLLGPEERLKFMSCQEYFLVELAGIVLGVDVNERELPGVRTTIQVSYRHHMRVDKPRPRRLRCQSISNMTVGWNFKALLFRSAIDSHWDDLPVPVDELGSIRIIEQLDCHGSTLAEANDPSGY